MRHNSSKNTKQQATFMILTSKSPHELEEKVRRAKKRGYWVTARFAKDGKHYVKLRCR